MGCLLAVIILGFLMCFNVISATLFGYLVLASILWTWLGSVLYFAVGLLKFFYHDFLKWHIPCKNSTWTEGINEHAICKHCGKEIMKDCQGNWFEI